MESPTIGKARLIMNRYDRSCFTCLFVDKKHIYQPTSDNRRGRVVMNAYYNVVTQVVDGSNPAMCKIFFKHLTCYILFKNVLSLLINFVVYVRTEKHNAAAEIALIGKRSCVSSTQTQQLFK